MRTSNSVFAILVYIKTSALLSFTAPSPPIITMAYNTTSTSIRVKWDPPLYSNGIIRSYQITYYEIASITDPSVIASFRTLNVNASERSYELVGFRLFTTCIISIQGWTIKLGEASTVTVKTGMFFVYIKYFNTPLC